MAENKVRLLTFDHKPSTDEYVAISKPSIRGMVSLRNVRTGEIITAQKRRILPLDTAGKAIAACNSNKTTIVCPTPNCILELQIQEGGQTARCPEHGEFPIYPYNVNSLPLQSTTTKVTRKEKSMPNVQVDLQEVKKYGTLYVRRADFNHTSYDVRSYVLVADNPPRKLCFNTYNGSLGKKSKDFVAELHLVEFSKDEPTNGSKYKVHYASMESIIKSLAKDFEQV